MMIGLPIITFLYARYCDNSGWPMKGFHLGQLYPSNLWNEFLKSWDTEVFIIYVGYWLYQVFLYFTLPCQWVKGVKLADGNQLLYPLNGLLSSIVTFTGIIVIHFTQIFGPKYHLGWIADNQLQITVATLVFSFS
jgi:Ergosterol biosynthesis ERG4/ERG24 family